MRIDAGTYTLRPLEYRDKDFIVQCLLDLPLQTMSVLACEREFSNMEYLTRGFDEANVTSDAACCMILERGGDRISFRLTRFMNNHAEIALLARLPGKRGQGHQDPDSFMHGWWYFERMSIASCWFEGVDTVDVQAAAKKWKDGTAAVEETRNSVRGDKKLLRKVVILPSEFATLKAANGTYSTIPVTYTP